MSDKKNIDRLFQEKLKDFEVAPSDAIWENISKEISKGNSQRKAIPIWQKLAGIAAGLLLLFTIGSLLTKSDNNSPEQNVVNSDSEQSDQIDPNKNRTINLDSIHSKNVVSEDSSEDVITNPEELLNINSEKTDPVLNSFKGKRNSVVSNKKQNSNGDGILRKDILEKKETNTLAQNTSNTDVVDKKLEGTANDKANENSIITDLNENNQNTNVANLDPKKVEAVTEDSSNLKTDQDEGNLSITDAVAANNTEDENKEEVKNINRWSITPNIAPVYFNTLGTGSSIHGQFNNNSKSGDVNMSYGISASYGITSKLSVRTGIHKVNLGYSTNDVVVYNNTQSPNINPLLRNIDFNNEAQEFSFISVNEFNFAQVPSVISNHLNASIDQKLGFLEIPLEIQYNLSNSKLGVSVIGGVSALILNENEIFSVQNGITTLLGKATNINNMSYSANFGFGLDYKVSKKFNLNLEPVFKYQLNTFKNTSGNFKPYFIGVYSGFSFKF